MLSAEDRVEAEIRLKELSAEVGLEENIKKKIKGNSKRIVELIDSVRENPKEQMALYSQICSTASKLIIGLEAKNRFILDIDNNMKQEKEQLNREKNRCFEEKLRIDHSINEIKDTIKKIKITVDDSIKEEGEKRKKIEDDLEKSLDQIRSKIKSFQEDSETMETQLTPLRQKVIEIKGKMEGLEGNFKTKAEEKDEEVKVEKEELMEKLRLLEVEVNRVTELNKEYSAIEKKNFDQKLSVHLRTEKFGEYSSSFQNSAETIGHCKEQLIRGAQRMSEAHEKIETSNSSAKQLSDQYLVGLKKRVGKEDKIQGVKKEKEEVRARILQLQSKIKDKNQKKSE